MIVNHVSDVNRVPDWVEQEPESYFAKYKDLPTTEKEAIIAISLTQEEGKAALCQAMAEPIRRSLEYQSLVGKALLIDEIAGGTNMFDITPIYEAPLNGKVFAIPAVNQPAIELQPEDGDIVVPSFVTSVIAEASLQKIKQRRFYIIDRAQIVAKQKMQEQEETMLVNLLTTTATAEGGLLITPGTEGLHGVDQRHSIGQASLKLAFKMIARNDYLPTKVFMNPEDYIEYAWNNDDKEFNTATYREVLTSNLWGHQLTADIHVSTMIEKGTAFVLAASDCVGAFPIKRDITVTTLPETGTHMRWLISRETGMAVINQNAVCFIDLRS